MSTSRSKDDIADKIRALLLKTVANGASEAEAASALSMAAALVAKHNLGRAEVSASAPREFEKQQAHHASEMPLNFVFASRVIEVACEVHVCIIRHTFWGRQEVLFEVFGDTANVEAGVSLLKYLAGVFLDLWIAQRARGDDSSRSEAGYYEGLRAGLLVQLEREKEEREAKVPRRTGTELAKSQQRLDTAFAEEYPQIKDLEVPADHAAFDAGARDSRKVSLRRGIE